jgi:hypothetical protein
MLHDARTSNATAPVSAGSFKQLLRQCEEIANADPGDTNRIGALLQQMILTYYGDVRKQTVQAFWSALAAATIGMLFFLYAIAHTMTVGGTDTSRIGFLAGALSQFISAVNFYLYFKASRQFASFHVCLERTNRFLLANAMCEKLEQPGRDQSRRELVQIIASAPMLTFELVTGSQGHSG